MSAGRDEVNYFIANKTINVNGVNKKLVFVGCIGSYKDQWFSNFDPNGTERKTNYAGNSEKGNVHLGFADARDFVYSKLDEYLTDNGIDRSSVVLLMTGHSRGAATANLLAAKLIDNDSSFGISKNNIYTYTFATPNTVKSNARLQKHSSIYNIVNPEDFVTKVLPRDWGFSRYGTTYTLPSKTNEYSSTYNKYLKNVQNYMALHGNTTVYKPYSSGESTVYKIVDSMTSSVGNLKEYYSKKDLVSQTTLFDYFKALCPFVAGGEDWSNYAKMVGSLYLNFTLKQKFTTFFIQHQVVRSDFENSHLMETYAAYMNTLTYSQLTKKRKGYKNTINCPVDVEVYDNATGELVGRIVDNVIDEKIAENENSVVMDVDGDSKSFWLPSDGDYEIKLIGNDEGTMDYTVATIDSDIGEIERINFFDVDIEDGKTMTGEIEGSDFVLEDYTLELDNGNVIEPTEQAGDISDVAINISAEGNGTVSESMVVTSGDYVTISATPNDGNMFAGWYNGETLVSSEATYSFVAKENVNLVAKFEINKYIAKLMVDGKLYKEIQYNEGQKSISLPPVPEKDGYTGVWESYSLTNGGTTINAIYTPIVKPSVKSVQIDDITLNYKQSTTLKPTIAADDDVKYTVEYKSSDTSVATVDENGNVYASGKGNATITCTVTDQYGNVVTDTSNVNVNYSFGQWLIVILLFGWIWY